MPLGPLDRADTARLAAAVPVASSTRDDAEALHDRTQGIPFYIEEMAGMLALQGVATKPAAWRCPETILDAVLLRMDVLSRRPGASALETAAVAGPRPRCRRRAGPASAATPSARRWRAGFLVESGGGIVAFRHVLVRDAIYHAIPWTRRQSLHAAQWLAALEEARRHRPATAPRHWLGAGDVERARTALCEAAAAASAGVLRVPRRGARSTSARSSSAAAATRSGSSCSSGLRCARSWPATSPHPRAAGAR